MSRHHKDQVEPYNQYMGVHSVFNEEEEKKEEEEEEVVLLLAAIVKKSKHSRKRISRSVDEVVLYAEDGRVADIGWLIPACAAVP